MREYGLALVSAPLGLAPVTVARFIAGDSLSLKSSHAIDRAFEQLGFSLGLEAPSRIAPVPSGAPQLVVIDGERGGDSSAPPDPRPVDVPGTLVVLRERLNADAPTS